jgi:hypothetical protein
MANLILTHEQTSTSPFDVICQFDNRGNEWWSARDLQKMLGYTKWQMFENAIEQGLENLESAVGDISKHALLLEVTLKHQKAKDYKFSRSACYHVALACDSRGKPNVKAAKHYFAIKTREAEVVIPAQSDRIRELELEVRLAELHGVAVTNASLLVSMHGESLGLTIAGLNIGQIVEVKVLYPVTGNTAEFLDAKQLVAEVHRRSGQKVKSNAEFIRQVKAANRDDLTISVTRNATGEYIKPDKLDEAIELVYGRCKQQLLAPSQSAIA